MKQKFTLSWLALTMTLLLFGGGIKSWGTELTLNLNELYQNGSKVTTKTIIDQANGTLSFTDQSGIVSLLLTRKSSNQPGFYTSSGYLRFYTNDLLDVSISSNYKIISIVITSNGKIFSLKTLTGLNTSTKTWTGNASKVSFEGNGTNKWDKIVITYKTATTLSLDHTSESLVVGGSDLTITPTVSYTGGSTVSSPTITWQTSNEDVATVTDGKVNAVAAGTATITAKYAGDETYAAATDATCSITVENAPSYTITAESNNTELGTVALVGSRITATPATNCRLTSTPYTVTVGTATVAQDGNFFTVTPSTDCTVRINFEAIPSHTATFSVNGIESSTDFMEGETITFPSNPADVNFKKFMGWYGNTYSHASTAPTYVNTATETMGTANKTYYAVFADVSESPASLTQMTSDSFNNNDRIVIVVASGTDALYQETVNSTYVNKYTFDNKLSTVSSDDKKWITLNTGTTSETWTLGDETNGYVYNNSGNDLKISTDSKTNFTITYVPGSGYKIVGNSRRLSYRSDLSNKYFRMGGSDVEAPSGDAFFDIYKYTPISYTYSNFCTTVPAATITYDEASTTAPVLCAQANVTLTRTLSASYWNTFAVPFDAAIPTGWTVKQFKSESDGTMEFEDATTLEAGKPYLVKPASDAVNPTFSNVSITATDGATMGSSLTFTGLLCQKSYNVLGPNPAYLATNGTVKKLTSGSMKGMRAYFNVPSNNSKLNIVIDGVSLGIDQIDGGQLSNGNAKVYNLNGQEVKVPRRGIYIHNGKKVVKQ